MLPMPSRCRACGCVYCRGEENALTSAESRVMRDYLASVTLRALFSAEASPEWRLRRAFRDLRRSWRRDEIFTLVSAEKKLGVTELPADRSFVALVDTVGLYIPPRSAAA